MKKIIIMLILAVFMTGCGGGGGGGGSSGSNNSNPVIPSATLSSITVSSSATLVSAGGTLQFTATGKYSDNSTADITSFVSWLSSSTSVATIDASGKLTGVSSGTTAVSATKDGITSNSVSVTVTASSSTDSGTQRIVFASNRDGIAQGDADIYYVYLMNTDGTNQQKITRGYYPDLSDDGKIVFNGQPTGIYIINADGTGLKQLSGTGLKPVFFPDNKRVLFNDGGALKIFNIETSQLTSLGQLGGTFYDVHPDGTKIVYVVWDLGEPIVYTIYEINVDGTGNKQIYRYTNSWSQVPFETGPSYSPDGKKIVFSKWVYYEIIGLQWPAMEIFTINSDGAGLTQITSGTTTGAEFGNYDSVFSPDGSKIYFYSAPDGWSINKIFSINADGTGKTQLSAEGLYGDSNPRVGKISGSARNFVKLGD